METMPQRNESREHYLPLSKREEEIGKAIVESAFTVHKALGPGLLEKVYDGITFIVSCKP